jgi:maltose alpha-D-glucosyltransferase / alpha-amylase
MGVASGFATARDLSGDVSVVRLMAGLPAAPLHQPFPGAMTDSRSRSWYKDAVIYQLHVKAFHDGDGDGVGDFAGLARKLDYIQSLGVTVVWLLPFYPSPLRDDGYDIADYRSVHPSYGNLRDVRRFLRECHARGLRVITELVINHTSDQHPWFRRARAAKPGSAARNYYVWSGTDQRYSGTRIIFLDTEKSNWTWDETAGAYYWHRFYAHQPDLNFENPRVLREVLSVMRFWLDLGVDGLRLDAVPYLREREGTNNENLPETHEVLKAIRAEIDRDYEGRMLLAEANQWPEDVLPYFGDPAAGGDECHMAFHFPLMPRFYMGVAMEDRHPIADILRQTPEIPSDCQWAIFLRNHDELTLEMVTNEERDYLWSFYAADRRMRINLGIRRRLAPLLENDRRKVELLNSLMLSMHGTPVVYYGDEIGMGDNIYLGDRDGVRTPMQWSPDRNGGFSRADPARLYLPPIQDPIYGFEAVNVEAQERSPSSLLHWMRRLIGTRQRSRAFGRGGLRLLYPANRKILAYIRHLDADERGEGEEAVLCVANLSRSAQAVELDLKEWQGRVPVEMLGRTPFPAIGELTYLLTLPAYGFYWFELTRATAVVAAAAPEPPAETVTVVMREGWASVLKSAVLEQIARHSLPAYLPKQRWFGAKDRRIGSVEIDRLAVLPGPGDGFLLARAVVRPRGGDVQCYFVPLAVDWTSTGPGPAVVARARRVATAGTLVDAGGSEAFVLSLLSAMREERTIPSPDGTIRFLPTHRLAEVDTAGLPLRRLGGEQSNSSVLIGEAVVVKVLRRLHGGPHPEAEMGRFLTDVAQYPNVPPLLGTAEFAAADGTATVLAIATGYVRNQGDGRTTTLALLARELDDVRSGVDRLRDEAAAGGNPFGFATALAETLGRRTAEMHRALATPTGDPAFDPEPVTADDLGAWAGRTRALIEAGCAAVAKALPVLEGAARTAAEQLLAAEAAARAAVDRLARGPLDAVKIRVHGDYHLGQVLNVKNDWAIIDFEGEPSRPLEERRAKRSALVDVAGMIRSYSYVVQSAVADARAALPEGGSDARLAAVAAAWERAVAGAFLAAYRDSIAGSAVWPAGEGAGERLLGLFLLEKAFYEIVYEAANRPDWLAIPVKGVLELLERETA